MPTVKMIERLARIMCVSETTDDPDDVALSLGTGKKRWQAWEKSAANVIALLSDCGYVIMPREPTEAMLAEGGELLLDGRIEIEAAEANARGVWRAMVGALAEKSYSR